MSTTLTLSEAQIDSLANKLDALDLTLEEQAALVAVLGAGEPGSGDADADGDWNLPSPGEGLRNAFTSGQADEVSGFAAGSLGVSVSVGWSALA